MRTDDNDKEIISDTKWLGLFFVLKGLNYILVGLFAHGMVMETSNIET